jgi:hypothetical protein
MYTVLKANRFKKYFSFIFILAVSDLFGTTVCEQKFELLGLDTAKTKMLYITETLSGECYHVKLFCLEVSRNSVIERVQKYKVDDTLEKTQEQVKQQIVEKISLTAEKPVEFSYQDSVWQNPLFDWQIKKSITPAHLFDRMSNTKFMVGFLWNRENKERGILAPVFINNKALLLYYHPAGLYIDYEIERIYYFVRSHYILIFTHQERKAVGLDTMHGFILYKLID